MCCGWRRRLATGTNGNCDQQLTTTSTPAVTGTLSGKLAPGSGGKRLLTVLSVGMSAWLAGRVSLSLSLSLTHRLGYCQLVSLVSAVTGGKAS